MDEEDFLKESCNLVLNTIATALDNSINPPHWIIPNIIDGTYHRNNFTFYNFNTILRNAMGDMYDQYNIFKINLFCVGASPNNAYYNGDNDRFYTMIMSGLNFINPNNTVSNKNTIINNDSWTMGAYISSPTNAGYTYFYYPSQNYILFRKPTQNTNITIKYHTNDDMKITTAAYMYPYQTFYFKIYGVA